MESNFHGLPPHKRFRLTQKQEEEEEEKHSDATVQAISCLPAKKRKQIREDSSPFPPNSNTSYCLPAKKRVWAFRPFDLNLEYEPTIDPDGKLLDIGEFGNVTDDLIEGPPELEANECKEEADDDNDGIACAVCGSTDGDPTDPIVLCDGCDLMVHVTCYGCPFTEDGIPEGDWFCAKCLASKSDTSREISCCLCPNGGGAMKPTTGGEWAHLVCAIYVPEVYFEDWRGRKGIDCSKVLERRWRGECYICGIKNRGCVVDCSEPKCGLGFHVTCGVKEELCIEYRQGRSRDKGGVVAAFCKSHTDLWKKQEQTGKFKIVARDEERK